MNGPELVKERSVSSSLAPDILLVRFEMIFTEFCSRRFLGRIRPYPNALALTRINDVPADKLILSIITINTGQYLWHQDGDFFTAVVMAAKGRPAKKATADINRILQHEIGHALGFGHSGIPESIMHPNLHAKTGDDGFCSDDLVGIATLYPK